MSGVINELTLLTMSFCHWDCMEEGLFNETTISIVHDQMINKISRTTPVVSTNVSSYQIE